jgi:hypothetical protein
MQTIAFWRCFLNTTFKPLLTRSFSWSFLGRFLVFAWFQASTGRTKRRCRLLGRVLFPAMSSNALVPFLTTVVARG